MMPGHGAPRQVVGGDADSWGSATSRRGEYMKTVIGPHAKSAMAAALIALCPSVASAQTAAPPAQKTTPERIKAAIGAIDSASIQANAATSKDWPTVGADYAE